MSSSSGPGRRAHRRHRTRRSGLDRSPCWRPATAWAAAPGPTPLTAPCSRSAASGSRRTRRPPRTCWTNWASRPTPATARASPSTSARTASRPLHRRHLPRGPRRPSRDGQAHRPAGRPRRRNRPRPSRGRTPRPASWTPSPSTTGCARLRRRGGLQQHRPVHRRRHAHQAGPRLLRPAGRADGRLRRVLHHLTDEDFILDKRVVGGMQQVSLLLARSWVTTSSLQPGAHHQLEPDRRRRRTASPSCPSGPPSTPGS